MFRRNSRINYNSLNYKILDIDKSSTDKICIKADEYNNKLYQKAMKTLTKHHNKLRKSNINLNINIEKPPKLSNYERLQEFRKNAILKPCFKQSQATLYLYEKGLILGKDYSACDAIRLYNNMKSKRHNKKITKKNNITLQENVTIIHDERPFNQNIKRYSIQDNRNIRKILPPIHQDIIINDTNEFDNRIDDTNNYDTSDEETRYGFKTHFITPSAPPYEEGNYIFEDSSKC